MTENRILRNVPAWAIPPAEVLFVLLIYLVLLKLLEGLAHLSPADYASAWPSLQLFEKLGIPLTLVGVCTLFALSYFGHLTATWDFFESGRLLRIAVVVLAAASAWQLTTDWENCASAVIPN